MADEWTVGIFICLSRAAPNDQPAELLIDRPQNPILILKTSSDSGYHRRSLHVGGTSYEVLAKDAADCGQRVYRDHQHIDGWSTSGQTAAFIVVALDIKLMMPIRLGRRQTATQRQKEHAPLIKLNDADMKFARSVTLMLL